MKMEEGNVVSADVFIDGWMSDETSWGRPVTPLFKDGSMLISDDQADSIIRVTYKVNLLNQSKFHRYLLAENQVPSSDT